MQYIYSPQNLGRRLLTTLIWSAKLVEPYKDNIACRTEIENKVHIHVRLHGYEARGAVHEHVGGKTPRNPIMSL